MPLSPSRAATVLSDRRPPRAGLGVPAAEATACGAGRARVWSAPSRSALFTTKTSADLEDARLGRLDAVAHARREQHQRGVGQRGDLDLGLPDPDGLDQDDVAAGGVEHAQRLRRGPRQPAEVPAGGHRADVDAACRARGPASAPGRRAARRRRTASDGSTASTPTRLPCARSRPTSARRRRRLADPGRAGEAEHLRAAPGERAQRRRPPRAAPALASSTSEISRATERASPARRPRRAPGRRRPTLRRPAEPRRRRLWTAVPSRTSVTPGRARAGRARRPGRRRRTGRPRRRRRRAAAARARGAARSAHR